MFTLKIHTVDSPQALHTAAADSKNNLKPAQLMGIAHLFRQLSSPGMPPITIANIAARTKLLFVVAVPNYFSSDDFLLFCGNHVQHFLEILFLRNDGMEDRYSVLIRLESQLAADGFYCSYNGKKFKPPEVEVCRICFSQKVDYSDSAEIASLPPIYYTELPSCPVCLERLDTDTSGIQSTLCDHSFRCSCVANWTLLSCPVCRLCQQLGEKPSCAVCGTFKNLRICLICGFVGCGRYEKGHASGHCSDKQHHFSLDLEKQQIWDYVGDKYVHRLNQSKNDGKSATVNSRCTSSEECGTCGYEEVEGADDDPFNSKIEGYYESLLVEAKGRKETTVAKAVEKATHDLEYHLEKYAEEKKAAAERNKELTKKQEFLQEKYKEIEERAKQSMMSKISKVRKLEDQVLNKYNRLLVDPLDDQKKYYESLLVEAKGRKDTTVAKAIEKAICSKTRDLESQLKKYAEEKKAAAQRNKELTKKQEFLQEKYKEIEERAKSSIMSKISKVRKLEDQLRDSKVCTNSY